jgi:hypothetical protein
MSINHPSVVRQSVFTTVTCGVAVLIALSMLYTLVNFPDESGVFLTSVGAILAALYQPNAAILHPLLLPCYDLFFWLLSLPMTALCVSVPLYAWCYSVAHKLRVKGIRNRYTTTVATARSFLGVFVCLLIYLKVLPLLGHGPDLLAFITFTASTVIKMLMERNWYDDFDKKQRQNAQSPTEATEEAGLMNEVKKSHDPETT